MKKLLALTLILIMALILAACGNNSRNSTNNNENSTQKKTETATSDKKTESNNQTQSGTAKKNILVVYFSHSGNTREIANQIHERVGGDIFEIKTVDPYPTDYNTLIDQAKKEQEENYRPKLAAKVENMDSYDVIFVGYPNWWGTMPMAVFNFLEGYNFSGKTIVPFCTHEGSGLGRSVTDIEKICPQSTILKGLAIRGRNVKSAQKDVSKWLNEIGIVKE